METTDINAVVGALTPIIKQYVSEAIEPLKAENERLRRSLSEAVAVIKQPKDGVDGKSVTVADVLPVINEVVEKAIASLPPPTQIRDALINRDGDLIISMTNGETKSIGRVVGRDGKDAIEHEMYSRINQAFLDKMQEAIDIGITKAVASLPDTIHVRDAVIDHEGKLVIMLTNGEAKTLGRVVGDDGKDGDDGLGFDDMIEEVSSDGREIVRIYQRGNEIKEFRHHVPAIIDCGIFSEQKSYDIGDAVTWGGSLWIAQKKTSEKPGTNNEWRLAVKKGRDGKDAVPKVDKGAVVVKAHGGPTNGSK